MREVIARYFQLVVFFPIFTLLKVFFGFEVRGKENLKILKNKPVIFAGNHNSRKFDGVISATAIAKSSDSFKLGELLPVRYLVYKFFFKWFRLSLPMPFPLSFVVAGWLRSSNCIPVKNRKREEYKNLRLKSLLQNAIEALKNGEGLFVFPEGKTGGDNKLRKGKRGVACLHRETGVPIVPVGISGSYKLFTLKNFLKPRNEKKVVVTFGEPIYNLWEENDSKKSLKEGASKVISEISRLI